VVCKSGLRCWRLVRRAGWGEGGGETLVRDAPALGDSLDGRCREIRRRVGKGTAEGSLGYGATEGGMAWNWNHVGATTGPACWVLGVITHLNSEFLVLLSCRSASLGIECLEGCRAAARRVTRIANNESSARQGWRSFGVR
jgi:hypothetical protein